MGGGDPSQLDAGADLELLEDMAFATAIRSSSRSLSRNPRAWLAAPVTVTIAGVSEARSEASWTACRPSALSPAASASLSSAT
jgi:hypothetical protein